MKSNPRTTRTAEQHDLTRKWSLLKFNKPPFVLPGDELALGKAKVEMVWPTSRDLQQSNEILDSGTRLHCGLIPGPYAGKIYSASIYVIMLNPGFSNLDVFAEENSIEFRQALIKNLSGSEPNLCFDPQFMWTGGFAYWTRKFRTHITQLAKVHTKPVRDVLALLADEVAFLELVPYHSQSFGLGDSLLDNLKSVSLIRSFFNGVIVPRSKKDKCLIIITRKSKFWDPPKNKNIVVYPSKHARGGHLSENSYSGVKIRAQLEKAAKLAWGVPQ